MSPPAYGQDGGDVVEVTSEQRELNDQALDSIEQEKYVRAISLLEEALYLGEVNILYLNLGRAYQLDGRCDEAREALEKVEDAPVIAKPPAGFVETKAEQYLAEVAEECTPDGSTVPTESRGMPLGKGAQSAPADQADTDVPTARADADTSESAGRSNAMAFVLGGAGLAAGGVALGLHISAVSLRDDTIERASSGEITQPQFVENERAFKRRELTALSLAVGGAALAGAGAYLFFTSREGESKTALRPLVGPDTFGVRLKLELP
jgi:tetratricopeptide (TPR) repeat protein